VCLCQQVEAAALSVDRNDRGDATEVRLTMGLPNMGQPQTVMASIDLTGYKADYRISRHTVVASFSLRRAQNVDLAAYVRESGSEAL
jgi:hypothetical protein